jgi:hypothetical protein
VYQGAGNNSILKKMKILEIFENKDYATAYLTKLAYTLKVSVPNASI